MPSIWLFRVTEQCGGFRCLYRTSVRHRYTWLFTGPYDFAVTTRYASYGKPSSKPTDNTQRSVNLLRMFWRYHIVIPEQASLFFPSFLSFQSCQMRPLWLSRRRYDYSSRSSIGKARSTIPSRHRRPQGCLPRCCPDCGCLRC